MKKIALFCLCLFSVCSLNASTVPLKTGRWVLDRYRNVEIDQFDYTYQVQNTDPGQSRLQLQDGSVWQVMPMNAEAASFYKYRNPFGAVPEAVSLFSSWQAGDTLIFHKIVNRSTLLAYNVTKDLLLDVMPVRSPANAGLKITSITNTNDVSYTYSYNNKTQSLQQYQSNNWHTVIVLSDGSVWEGNPSKPLTSWIAGDAIHVAKDTPWWSANTHILMNFKPTRSRANATPDYGRLGVWRAG